MNRYELREINGVKHMYDTQIGAIITRGWVIHLLNECEEKVEDARAEERAGWEKTVKESLYPAAREIIQKEERERIAKHFASFDVVEMRGADLAREILEMKP